MSLVEHHSLGVTPSPSLTNKRNSLKQHLYWIMLRHLPLSIIQFRVCCIIALSKYIGFVNMMIQLIKSVKLQCIIIGNDGQVAMSHLGGESRVKCPMSISPIIIV